MRCETVQRWLLMRHEIEAEHPGFEAHLTTCTACQTFQKNLIMLRQNLDQAESPEPSEALVQHTADQCQSLIRIDESARTTETPKWILASILGWMFATMFLIGFTFYQADAGWNVQKTVALIFTVQNILMLLFSPLLLAKLQFSNVTQNQKQENLSILINSFCI